MSKIEDALKKAGKKRSNNLSVVTSNYDANKDGNNKDLSVSVNNLNPSINHKSSVKTIALMNETELLENNVLSELKVIFPEMPDDKIADVYRDLRTKLLQQSNGANISVMLTSCVSGYYSNMTALNLAAAFSFDESKTSLLIDCNLNDPKLDKILDLEPKNGLTDYLENDEVSIDSILHESGIKRLRIIPAGRTRETATEYFTSIKMKSLMSDLLTRYSDRYIFIDAAPIVESADTRILVELCDYVLLVVPYGKATKSRVKEAADAIGAKLLGVVFEDKPIAPKLFIQKNKR